VYDSNSSYVIRKGPVSYANPVTGCGCCRYLRRVIEAAHEPGPERDEIIREAINGDAAERLDQVRVIVCS